MLQGSQCFPSILVHEVEIVILLDEDGGVFWQLKQMQKCEPRLIKIAQSLFTCRKLISAIVVHIASVPVGAGLRGCSRTANKAGDDHTMLVAPKQVLSTRFPRPMK